jgi:hypothetical protein
MRRVGVAVGVVVAASSFAAFALAAQSPRSLLASMLRSARARHSVHYVTRAGLGADSKVVIVGDVAADRGVQRVTEKFGKRSNTLKVIVVGATAYVRGGKRGLENQVGLTSARASRYAGRWISIPKGTELYGLVVDGATLPAFLRSIVPASHSRFKERSTTIRGTKVIEIRALSKNGELDLAAPLRGGPPVEETQVAGGGAGSTTMSRWNEAVQVQAPPHAVPIATVRG